MRAAVALLALGLAAAGPAWAQERPSDETVRGWFDHAAGTDAWPIGRVVTPGNPPVSNRVEHVERCSAILILSGVNSSSSDVAQQVHYPLVLSHVQGGVPVPHGVALVQSSYGVQPVLDIPTDPATFAAVGQVIRECGTPAALRVTYDALVNLLRQTLTPATGGWGLTLREEGECRLTLTTRARRYAIVTPYGDPAAYVSPDLVSADRRLLKLARLAGGQEDHVETGPEVASRADRLVETLQSHCAIMADAREAAAAAG